MAIATLDQWIAAPKQDIEIIKTASVTAVAAMYTQILQAAGQPGAGTLAGTNTANGVVPTDATAGCPTINAFVGANKGYLGYVDFTSSVTGILEIHDMLFKAGAYAFNANTTLASQPSYSSRVPGGTDFKGTEIWIEAVTAFTGNQSIAVTYTNQDGTAGRTTGTIATGVAPIVGRMLQLPLQAGDTGVQKIESVVSTVATAGTFNVLVTRRLWRGRVNIANGGDRHDFLKTGAPEVFADSALILLSRPDSTATGLPAVMFDIANG